MEFKVNTDYYEKLGPLRLYVYSYLKQNPNSTREQALNDLNMSDRTFRDALYRLVDDGYIRTFWGASNHNRPKMVGVEVLK